jgi:hypothetical protein
MLSKEKALELYEYKDGKLYCKTKTSKKSTKIKIGDEIGSLNSSEYLRTRINYKEYFVHKIIFLMHHGYTPQIVDHIDGNTLNNNIENLRAVNLSQNQHNRGIDKRNKSGYKNVSFCKRTKMWAVGIAVKNKKIFLGRFKDIELADLVAIEARKKYHGEYARELVCSR